MNSTPAKRHVLTVLLEDYFQVGAFDRLIREQNWMRFEPRYVQNTLKALELLDAHNAKATFFVLGWIADQSPDLIKEIVARGHEVASRGYNHCPVSRMTSAEFRADVLRTRDILERASGRRIVGHRAAEKLNYATDAWTLDVLANEDFAYDASFMPTWNTVKNARFRRFAHEHRAGEKTIHELPYSTARMTKYLLPISGGNYFRQLPYTFLRRAVEKWHAEQDAPFVLYFHIWELDAEQPRISAASRLNRIRHYRKLDKMSWILGENLTRYNFTTAADFLNTDCRLQIADCANADKNAVYEIKSQAETLQPEISQSEIQNPKSKVTVVIPCYNEEKTLPYLANTLRGLEAKLGEYDLQFLFVDDASRDATSARLIEIFAGKSNVKIVRHEMNKGVAAGIMTGIRAAETEIVCSMDADCTYDPNELVNLIPLLTPDVALVTASPYHPSGGVRNVPAWRLGLSKGASWLYRQTLQQDLHTFTSCFRVYRKSTIEKIELKENGFLGVAELLGKLALSGERIVEHPAVLEVRLFGFSKMKTLRTIFGHLKLLARLRKMRRKTERTKSASKNLLRAKSLKSS